MRLRRSESIKLAVRGHDLMVGGNSEWERQKLSSRIIVSVVG
jgi:hypothetical protein